jgi:hypothetical protein
MQPKKNSQIKLYFRLFFWFLFELLFRPEDVAYVISETSLSYYMALYLRSCSSDAVVLKGMMIQAAEFSKGDDIIVTSARGWSRTN